GGKAKCCRGNRFSRAERRNAAEEITFPARKGEMLRRKLLFPWWKSEMLRRKSLFPRGKSKMLRGKSLFPWWTGEIVRWKSLFPGGKAKCCGGNRFSVREKQNAVREIAFPVGRSRNPAFLVLLLGLIQNDSA